MDMLPGTSGYLPTLRRTADARGEVTWPLASLPRAADEEWYFQAVVTGPTGATSNVLHRPIRACALCVCPTDMFEPNNSPSELSPLGIGSNPSVVCGEDPDHYSIVVPAQHAVSVAADMAEDEWLSLVLLHADGSETGTSTTPVEWWNDSNVDVEVELQVHASRDEGSHGISHDLEVRVGPREVFCIDDGHENNDRLSAATPGLPSVDAVTCVGDEDWYAFNLLPDEFLRAQTRALHAVELRLFDSAGAPVASSDPNTWNSVSIASSTGGTYYIRVDNPAAGTGPAFGGGIAYNLTSEVGAVGHCIDDAAEDNDTLATASPFPASGFQAVMCGGDEDWYRIPVEAGQQVKTYGAPASLTESVRFELLDSSGALLDDSTYILTATAPAADVWYVRVLPMVDDAANDGVPYSLVLDDGGFFEPCVEDVFEDNDSATTATPMTSQVPLDAISCSGDDDHFSVAVGSGDTLVLSLDHQSEDERLFIDVFDPFGTSFLSSRPVRDTVYTLPVVTAGTYIVRVRYRSEPFRAAGIGYTLGAEVVTPLPCVDDVLEDNDRPRTASLLSGPQDLVSCAADTDWYAIDALRGELVHSEISAPAAGGAVLHELYDAAGNFLGASTATDSGDGFITHRAQADGRYLVKVTLDEDDLSGGGVPYTLHTESVPRQTCVVDNLEPNDGPTNATQVSTTFMDGVACLTDEDVFVFSGRLGELAIVRVDFDGTGQDVDLALYDSGGTLLGDSNLSSWDFDEVVRLLLDDGDYYVVVSSDQDDVFGGGVPYRLSVTTAGPGVCDTDPQEPDDTLGMASLLVPDAPGLTSRACGSDSDWYEVPMSAGDRVRVAVHTDEDDGWVYAVLYDGNATELVASFPDDAVSEQLIELDHTAAADGSVFVEIIQFDEWRGTATGVGYDISARFNDCVPDGFEPNSDPTQATTLLPGTYSQLSLCSRAGGEHGDYYRLDLLAGQTVTANATFSHDEGDIDLSLRRVSGTLLRGAASRDDDEELTYTATTDGPLVFRVFLRDDPGAFGNTYDLDLQIDP